tara:strand:+ start:792 stop:1313 length:522 start_codon:yes stop_codon:yes gene_type:complete
MKKILGIVVLGLFYNNICIAETISDRLSKIEDRLYKIEKLLESLEEIQEQTDSSNKKKKNKKTEISSKDKTLKMSDCLKVTDQRLSITERNDIFVRYAWIIDYKNSCNKDFTAYPVLEFLDESGFLLHEITNADRVIVPSNGTAQAKGSEMISPTSKASRITQTSAGLSSSPW